MERFFHSEVGNGTVRFYYERQPTDAGHKRVGSTEVFLQVPSQVGSMGTYWHGRHPIGMVIHGHRFALCQLLLVALIVNGMRYFLIWSGGPIMCKQLNSEVQRGVFNVFGRDPSFEIICNTSRKQVFHAVVVLLNVPNNGIRILL